MEIPFMKDQEVPTKEFYENAFKKLEASRSLGPKRLMKMFVKFFGTKPPVFLFLSNKDFLRAFCGYRIITEDEMKRIGLRPSRIKSFSHPPKSITKKQRFNIKGYPALYLSDSPHTAIEEKKNDIIIGEPFYLSIWKFKKFDQVGYINLLAGKIPPKGWEDIFESFNNKINSLIRNYSEDKRESLRYLVEKLIALSLENPHNNITSLFGYYYLREFGEKMNPPIRLIMYPSIRKNGYGINFAINPKLISNSDMECTEIRKLKLNNHSEIGSWITLEKIGIENKGKVIWKKFELEVNSLSFYDLNNVQILKFSARELQNMNQGGKELIKGWIYEVMQKHEPQLAKYSKMPNKSIKKVERIDLPKGSFIDNIKCSSVVLYIKFSFVKE
ncbi:MAG TPA: RES domain-containing protein [Bacteroidia bacterium]|nr:RES domain-containing protein [Bacteroidia bacterium]HRH08967.1 RES domain-containing protein [Bacteroidia bacterium]